MTVYRSLDLFSGCGGLSLGMSLAKNSKGDSISTACAIDIWEIACKTFEHNLGLKPLCEPIDDDLIRRVNQENGPFDIVVGGPPCQGFSTAGKRALDDDRNKLVLAFLRAIEITNPKVFVMENVTGFKTFQNGKIHEEVVLFAKKLGYQVRSAIVLASLSGVPQRRKRFLLVGSKVGAFKFPGEQALPHDENLFESDEFSLEKFFVQKPENGTEKWTFNDATSDLPALKAGQRLEKYKTPPKNSLQEYFRKGSELPLDHFAVGHREYFIEMLSYIPQGKSALDPEVQKTMPKKLRPTSGFKNSYQRIVGDAPSPTITRNFTTPSSANCIHPSQDRALSIREGARCQSFPDWFYFLGTTDEKRLQIGNAVPPLLGKAIGESILNALIESKKTKTKA
ncbi:DNA cytosine methyltransferase [Candidatus Planktophila dulcis]|uniref:DNA cytosine methyltransferase n=1 Tax=Candidatus Planktophila dulcis TaxID=1884914 RepID=UPI003CF62CC3